MKPQHSMRVVPIAAAVLVSGLVMGACSSDGSNGQSGNKNLGSSASSPVLPVASNPISNSSTAAGLEIDEVLVENNEDAQGKAVDDHLEVALANNGTSELSGFEIFYTFTDRKTGASESYYFQFPAGFTIPAGARRVAHFDDSGGVDHFPENKFSLYRTSTNAQDVEVTVSAEGVAPATTSVKKDKGGPEEAD